MLFQSFQEHICKRNKGTNILNRRSYMVANVILTVLNELENRDKMRGYRFLQPV